MAGDMFMCCSSSRTFKCSGVTPVSYSRPPTSCGRTSAASQPRTRLYTILPRIWYAETGGQWCGCWCDSVRKPLLHRSGQDEFIMIKLAKDTLMCDMAGSGDSSTLVLFISLAEVSHVSPVSDSSTMRNHFRQDTTVTNIPVVIGRRGCRGVRGGEGRGEEN